MKFFRLTIIIYFSVIKLSYSQIIDSCSKSGSLLVVEESTNKIIFENNIDKLIYPASLVKLMTAYLVIETIEQNQLSLDEILVFSHRAQEISQINKYNTLKINAGDKISVENALLGLIVKSYNENAIVLAEAVSGNEWNFVKLMNKKALQLGMINTSFRNASGLHEEGQYTTALDLAKLTLHLKKDFPKFFGLFSETQFSYNDLTLKTNNTFLHQYRGAEGMKTGYTSASGYNLIASAKRDDHRFFSVVTGCKNSSQRNLLTEFILDLSFEEIEKNNDFYLKKISLKSYDKIYKNL